MAMFQGIQELEIKDLKFDGRNPRLTEFSDSPIKDEREIIRILWENMDVRELVMSISASGFFRHEPLIVTKESGQYVVIEGNRRLAAVKLLTDSDLSKELKLNVQSIPEEEQTALRKLPCLLAQREDTWRYLGFKHVNGPAKWGSYPKALYIADVHQQYHIPLDLIAQQIGDTHNTVRRLFRGRMVIQQAENWKVFSREDRWNRRFAFSHLYIGITYQGISSFLDLNSETDADAAPVPSDKKEELGEFCIWLYGSKFKQMPPVIQSQNPHLRQLDAVLNDRAATAHLRNTRDLQASFSESRPPVNRFEEYLVAARDNLRNARAILSDGYDGSNTLQEIARGIVVLARDIYDDMGRKQDPKRP